MIVWIREGNIGGIQAVSLHGATVWEVTLPAGGTLKTYRRNKLWRKLQRMKVRQAAMCVHLEQEAGKWGICNVPVASLRRTLLPKLYEKCAIVNSEAVALRAEEATAEVYQAAEFLCCRRRYLVLDIHTNGDALADWLWRQYGISAGSTNQAVCGGITFTGEPRCAELHLGADCRKYQEVQYEVNVQRLPEELVAALWQSGVIKTAEIRVVSLRGILDTAPQSHYNATI